MLLHGWRRCHRSPWSNFEDDFGPMYAHIIGSCDTKSDAATAHFQNFDRHLLTNLNRFASLSCQNKHCCLLAVWAQNSTLP
jgi:hypothetical protein